MRIDIRTRVVILGVIAALPILLVDLYDAREAQRSAIDNAKTESLLRAHAVARLQSDIINRTRHLLFGFSTGLASAPQSLSFEADCAQRLQQIAKANPLHLNVALGDMNGDLRCAAYPLLKPVNVKNRPYFDRAVSKKGFALSELLISRDTGGPIMAAAHAVSGPDGLVRAVLIASFEVETLSQALAKPELPLNVTASLVTDEGLIIALRPHVVEYVGQTLQDFPPKQARQGPEEGTFELTDLEGIRRVAAYVRVPNVPDSALYVVTSIPHDDVERGSTMNVWRNLVAVSTLLFIVLALGFIGAQMLLVRPIRQLTNAAKRQRAGDLGARTAFPHDAGEIGTLAATLDSLAESNQRVTRAFRALSAGNRTLLREREESSLLQAMCRVAVEDAGYRLAFVNFAQQDERKSVKTVARAGFDDGFVDTLDLTWADTERGRGTVGSTIRGGQAAIVRSIATDARFAPWRDSAIARGFGSIASFPLRVDNAVIGTFTLVAAEEYAFARAELELLEEMAADLAFGIGALRSGARLAAAEAAARRAVTHDALTGLPGRVLLLRALDEAARRAQEGNEALAVIVVNLVNVQDLHDSLGYDASNAVIVEATRRLKFAIAPATELSRISEDDVGLLLPRADPPAVENLARRFQGLLAAPVNVKGVPVSVRFAFGASLYPAHGDTGDTLLRRATIAAREAARRELPFYLYSGASEREDPERLALAAELRVAIDERALGLHFQPKVSLDTGELKGAEALVRWPHPARGMVPPMQFVPIAEQTGLIRPMTAIVIELALRQLAAWRDRPKQIPIAVNLSPRNLHDPGLLDAITDGLQRAGVSASLLEIEITESALAEDPKTARTVLERLRALGCNIYIDDFGTGYSSLSYLVSLPLDAIKIDRSFIRQMTRSREAHAVVASILLMARELGLRTVAEGVETQEDAEMLRGLGCDEAQGYYFGRPVPPEAFAARSAT